jgi:hypothetical protein
MLSVSLLLAPFFKDPFALSKIGRRSTMREQLIIAQHNLTVIFEELKLIKKRQVEVMNEFFRANLRSADGTLNE